MISKSILSRIKRLFFINIDLKEIINQFQLFISQNIIPVFYGLLFFFLFLLFEPFFYANFDNLLIGKVFNHIAHPSLLMDLIFFFLVIFLLCFKKKMYAWDYLLIFFYVKFFVVNKKWIFWPLLPNNILSFNFRYIDLILLFYIIFFLKKICISFLNKNDSLNEYGFIYPDLDIEKLARINHTTLIEIDKRGLNRQQFANDIANIISSIKPFQAFVIGINGSWGVGKTSFIELIIENLRNLKNKNYSFVTFSPWFYTDTETLIKNFFASIEKELNKNFRYYSIAEELKRYNKNIFYSERSLFGTEIFNSFLNEDSDLKTHFDSISKKILSKNVTIIIVIDDLDRLDKKEVIDVLKLMRSIANFPNTIYLTAYDREYISSVIKDKLTDHNPEIFLDKIVNVEFCIPAIEYELLINRLKANIQWQLQQLGQIDKYPDGDEIERCFRYQDICEFLRNERDIKRFSNNLVIKFNTIKGRVNFYHFFLLELLSFRDFELTNKLWFNRTRLFEEHNKNNVRAPEEVIFGSDFLKEIFNDMNLDKVIINIVNELFSLSGRNYECSFSNRKFFSNYFTLTFKNYFFDREFNNAFNNEEEFVIKMKEFYDSNKELFFQKIFNKLFVEWLDSKYLQKSVNDLTKLKLFSNENGYDEFNNWFNNLENIFSFFQKNNNKIITRNSFQLTGDNNKYNDTEYMGSLDYKNNSFILLIEPKTEFWRLGFKFSEGESIVNARDRRNRHVDQYPIIHLAKGRKNNKEWFDFIPSKLQLTVYKGSTQLNSDIDMILNYNNEKILLLFYAKDESICINVLGEKGGFYQYSKENELYLDLRKYKFLKISAWCDFREYLIKNNIIIFNN